MNLRALVLSATLLLVSEYTLASNLTGRIGEIWASPTSYLVMFSVPDSQGKLHRCNTTGKFSINLSQPGGRATYELLLQAKRYGYVVSVETLNTCNAFEAENVKNISVK